MKFVSIFVLLGGAFLVAVVQTKNFQLDNETTAVCKSYEESTACNPCDKICNEKQPSCLQYCLSSPSYCKCKDNLVRVSKQNSTCIQKSSCPVPNYEN